MDSMSDFDPYTKISEVFDDGRLVLTDVIGAGSFAVVYMAETVATPKRRFAVKALFKHGLTPTQILLQRREAMLLKHLGTAPVRNASSKTSNITNSLNNNHIVRLEKTVETDDCIYLVMEWCRSDLYEVITSLANDGASMNDSAIKYLFGQLVDAVAFCHERGVSHRDLKPENVLISDGDSPENFTLKLTDFGLATTENWTTDYGTGSIRYMAPEVLDNDGNNRGYHPALNDIWSLGVILFNLVTGKNPWHTPSEDDLTFSEYFAAELDGKPPSDAAREAYFCENFGMTMQASRVFSRVFRLEPRQRCSIRELKELVASVDAFNEVTPMVEKVVVKAVPQLSMHRWASDVSGMDYSELPSFADSPAREKVLQTSAQVVPADDPAKTRPHTSDNNSSDLLPPRPSTTQRPKRQAAASASRSGENTKKPSTVADVPSREPTPPPARRGRRRYAATAARSPLSPAPVVTSCAAAMTPATAPPSTPTIAMAEAAAAQAMPYRRVIQDAASALRRIAAMFDDGRGSGGGGNNPALAGRVTTAAV